MDTWMNGWQTAGAGLEACGDWFMLADEWCECTPQGMDAGAAAALEGSQASTETARSRGSVVKSVRILRPGMSLSVKEGAVIETSALERGRLGRQLCSCGCCLRLLACGGPCCLPVSLGPAPRDGVARPSLGVGVAMRVSKVILKLPLHPVFIRLHWLSPPAHSGCSVSGCSGAARAQVGLWGAGGHCGGFAPLVLAEPQDSKY